MTSTTSSRRRDSHRSSAHGWNFGQSNITGRVQTIVTTSGRKCPLMMWPSCVLRTTAGAATITTMYAEHQHLNKSNTVRIDTRIMGGARINCQVADGFSDEPDRLHHKSALAPNVTHSMDAALIHLTFAFWDKPFTVIHDCVLGRSCDMDQMAHDIRLHFAEMYKAPVLQQWADEVGVSLPPDLMKNTLDIETVNRSTYLFC